MADDGNQHSPESYSRQRRTSTTQQEKFHQYFRQQTSLLLDQISRLEEFSVVGGERQDATEHVLAGISTLSCNVADASQSISPYNRRIYSDGIRNLEDTLRETTSRIAPNSRFRFKSKLKHSSVSFLDAKGETTTKLSQDPVKETEISRLNNPFDDTPNQDSNQNHENFQNEPSNATEQIPLPSGSTPHGMTDDDIFPLFSPSFSKNYDVEITREKNTGIRKPSFSQATRIDMSNHKNIHIILPPSASRATSAGSITKLEGCILDMSIPTTDKTPFASLVCKDIKDCLIVAGQVAGAAHITAIKDSILVVAARQVRIHECTNVKIYLYCASRPIIEDCKNIQFSPLPRCYMTSSQTLTGNQWDQVDDFDWQKSESSPNWTVIPAEERLPEKIWTDVVPGKLGVGLIDILKELGIK